MNQYNCTFDDGVLELPLVGARVADYRSFKIGCDGHFTGFQPLICADDAAAIAEAKRFIDGHDIELWCGDRLVIRLKAVPKS